MSYTRKEQRRAGAHARHLARSASHMRLFYLAAAAVGVYLGTRAVSPKPVRITDAPLLAAAALLLLYSLFQASKEHAATTKARVGATNESRVARVLSKMGPTYLINSAMLGAGGDADHVLIGPCLAVVETKSGHGPLSVRGRSLVVGARPIPGDPVAQAKRQAAAMSKLAGVYCDAIVCVADTTTPPQIDRGVTICSLAQLQGVVSALPTRVSAIEATNLNVKVRTRDLASR